jgi:hypothetical protein
LVSITALGQLGDSQAIAPLVGKLKDGDTETRQAVVSALGELGSLQVVPMLIPTLNGPDVEVQAMASVALHVLGDTQGRDAMSRLAVSEDRSARSAVCMAFAKQSDNCVKRLLSRDLDGVQPWLDPDCTIDDKFVQKGASILKITEEEVRNYYECLPPELGFKLAWKIETS